MAAKIGYKMFRIEINFKNENEPCGHKMLFKRCINIGKHLKLVDE